MPANTTESITRRYEERYAKGIGEGSAYVPWLDVRTVPSVGVSNRFNGRKTGRMHVALSNLERNAILVAQWLDDVVDIREQFPLWPLDETMAIAEELGVAHPAHRNSPILMSTDIVITKAGSARLEPLTVKPESELRDRRVLEKFEIERLYWGRRGCSLRIVTGKELPDALVENLQWFDEYYDIAPETLSPDAIRRIEAALLGLLRAHPEMPLNRLCADLDDRIGEPAGTCLGVVRHALARKRWKVPLDTRINPARPLPALERACNEILADALP